MGKSAFDRLIAMLPPERQAAPALSLECIAKDPNGPFSTIYSEVFGHLGRSHRDQQAGYAALEKLVPAQLANASVVSQQTIRAEVGCLHQGTLWRK